METKPKLEVYRAINGVQGDLAKDGISKDQENKGYGGGYKYRGIDAVYQALAPLLDKHCLIIIPRVLSRECIERKSSKGSPLYYVSLDVEFDLVCSKDGSMHTARTFGESMDSSDKATNKALTAAYKYLCFTIFCIPTEGSEDADAVTHNVMPKKEEVVSLDEVLGKIKEAKATKHLKNIWEKYGNKFEGEDRVKLIMAKDERKEELTNG
jgi:hypothetical protein